MFPDDAPDMQSLLSQAAAMHEQLMAAQEQLADLQVDGTAGGGLVTATVNGTGELLALNIDPQVCNADDTETLADLVVAAVRDAASNAQRAATEQMTGLASGAVGDEDGPAGPVVPPRE